MRVFGFAGWSGSGKTTLIEKLIPLLVQRGTKVSLIKHAHHTFDVDIPGKDSYRLRHAGCVEVLLTSQDRWALMHENRGAADLTFPESLARLSPCDLVLVEGYKQYAVPKLEVYRREVNKPPLHPNDDFIVGVATTDPDAIISPRPLQIFDLTQPETMVDFVLSQAIHIDRLPSP